MGRPVVNGRQILMQNGNVIGLCLGDGGYEEHHFYSLEDNVNFVEKINSVNTLALGLMGGMSKEDYNTFYNQYKKDMNLIKKLSKKYKGTDFPKYTQYILRPHVPVYERKVTIDNRNFKGNPGLRNGHYDYISIEGPTYYNSAKKMFHNQLNNRRVLQEDELFYSTDYKNSCYHYQDLYMSSWGRPYDRIQIIINSDYFFGVNKDLILSKLHSGYLGVVYGAFGKRGLCLLFLDRICFGRDMEV